MLKEQRVASSQKIHQGRCFTFIKGQRDNCLFSKMNLPVLYIPWKIEIKLNQNMMDRKTPTFIALYFVIRYFSVVFINIDVISTKKVPT